MSFQYPNETTFPQNTEYSDFPDNTRTMISDSWEREAFQPHQTDQCNHHAYSGPYGLDQNHSISGDPSCGPAPVTFSAPHTSSYPYDEQGSVHQMLPEITSFPHSSVTKPKRKPLYLWDEQEDPELEEKRRRAVKAFKNRQKNYKKEDDLERQVYDLEQEVEALEKEKCTRRCNISQLENLLYNGFHQQGQSEDGSYNFANEYSPY
ncbi:uncharacterized protein [Macrobrachium rosenbergii]|uniref:uncharacterized protein n=1 Tax=Macrobrachium rosenbergii TaxID=79674 RepID=UPI0034D5B32D